MKKKNLFPHINANKKKEKKISKDVLIIKYFELNKVI